MNQFTELHNLKKLKFIRDMKREDFVKYFTTPKEVQQNGDKIWINKEFDNVKKWATGMCKAEAVQTSYIYQSHKTNCPRLFCSNKVSFQSMPKRLRAFLARDNYVDVDIKNSAPNIIYWIAVNELDIKPEQIPLIKNYAENPDIIRASYGLDKNDFFKYYFDENCKGRNKWTKSFCEECKHIQNLAWEAELGMCKSILAESNNPKGKYLSNVYFHYERKYIDKVMDLIGRENIGSPIHDGFLLNKEKNIDLTEINSLFPENVNFIIKHFNEDWKCLTDDFEVYKEQPEEEVECIDFENITDEFFITHFFRLYKDIFRIRDDYKAIYYRDKFCWKEDTSKRVYLYCRKLIFELEADPGFQYISDKDLKIFKKYRNHSSLNPLTTKVRSVMEIELDIFEEETGLYLFFENGYFDIKKKLFIEKYDKYNLWNYDYKYNPNHQFTEDFVFEKICKDTLDTNYDLFFKYLLTSLNGIAIKKMLYLIGEGHNGKTTLLDCLEMAYGEHISLKASGNMFCYEMSVTSPRLEFTHLKGKRLVFTSEPTNSKLDISTMKALTGGEHTVARQLYSNEKVKFKNQFLFIVAANSEPNLDTVDKAIIDRFLFMEMKSRYVPNPRDEVVEEKQADPYYLSEEFQESQRIHIMHWLIQGHIKNTENLQDIHWTTPEDEFLKESLLLNNSEAVAYVSTNTIDAIGQEVLLQDLYKRYKLENPNSYLSIVQFNKDIGNTFKIKKGTSGNKKNRKVLVDKKILLLPADF